MVCKPSSVPTLRSGTVIHLRRRLPDVSSGRPESGATPPPPDLRPTALLFGLAPGRACPFHSARLPGWLVSVALVLASRRTGVTRYPASRSSDFPRISNGFRRRDTRPSDHLAGSLILPPEPTLPSFGDPGAGGIVQRHVGERVGLDVVLAPLMAE